LFDTCSLYSNLRYPIDLINKILVHSILELILHKGTLLYVSKVPY